MQIMALRRLSRVIVAHLRDDPGRQSVVKRGIMVMFSGHCANPLIRREALHRARACNLKKNHGIIYRPSSPHAPTHPPTCPIPLVGRWTSSWDQTILGKPVPGIAGRTHLGRQERQAVRWRRCPRGRRMRQLSFVDWLQAPSSCRPDGPSACW